MLDAPGIAGVRFDGERQVRDERTVSALDDRRAALVERVPRARAERRCGAGVAAAAVDARACVDRQPP